MSTHGPPHSSAPSTAQAWWKQWPEWKLALLFALLMLLFASALTMIMGGFFAMLTRSGYGSKDPAGAANDRRFVIVSAVLFVVSVVAILALKRSEAVRNDEIHH